jgi:hypothetical protein
MKRILPILFALAFVQSYAQKTQQSLGTKHTMVVALSDFKVDSLLFLPERDTTFTPYKNGAVVLKQSDSSLYYYAQYWRPMGGAFVKTVYKRNDSLFYQRGGAEYFIAKWGLRAFTVPAGLTATQIGDSISVTTALNGLVIGNGTGFATATVDTPLYYSSGMLRIAKASNDSSGYLSYFDWRAFNAKVDPSREVNGVMSITGGGPLNQNRNLSLVNDQLAPPASYYYGTNTVGVKGWFALPSGGDSNLVTSVHGRIGDIVAQVGDYSFYYSLKDHTHNGLIPIGGSTGQVLKKLSNNNYDVGWQDDLNEPGSVSGVGVDTIAKVGYDLVWRKNFTDYTIADVFHRYSPGNGIKFSNDTISIKHITVTEDSNILIGTQVNSGHRFYLKGQPRFDLGSDATGDTYYRDALGGMARLPKPAGLLKPVMGFSAGTNKPYWKEDEGSTNAFTTTTQLSDTSFTINRQDGSRDTVEIVSGDGSSSGDYAPVSHTHAASDITSGTKTSAFISDFTTAARGSISLTTIGASGAATYTNGVLNIPQYSGGGGETNTASNIGNGTGIFAQKVSADLQFKSLNPGTNISVTATDTTVTVSAPGDLVTFTPRFSAGAGQGDANIVIPVGHLFTELYPITVGSNLTVGLSTSSTSGGVTLYHIVANTNTNPTYNWQYSATVKTADGTVVTEIPKGKTHTILYITSGSYWMLTSEF